MKSTPLWVLLWDYSSILRITPQICLEVPWISPSKVHAQGNVRLRSTTFYTRTNGPCPWTCQRVHCFLMSKAVRKLVRSVLQLSFSIFLKENLMLLHKSPFQHLANLFGITDWGARGLKVGGSLEPVQASSSTPRRRWRDHLSRSRKFREKEKPEKHFLTNKSWYPSNRIMSGLYERKMASAFE